MNASTSLIASSSLSWMTSLAIEGVTAAGRPSSMICTVVSTPSAELLFAAGAGAAGAGVPKRPPDAGVPNNPPGAGVEPNSPPAGAEPKPPGAGAGVLAGSSLDLNAWSGAVVFNTPVGFASIFPTFTPPPSPVLVALGSSRRTSSRPPNSP